MIGKLRGIVDEINDDSLVLDVGGVGYQVFVSSRLLASASAGEALTLVIETNVREDHIHLYGFPDSLERDWFRLLATVQGVGNKTGLAILASYPPERLMQAILAKDIAAFKAISGIGPKLAERIVTELKDKALKMPASEFAVTPSAKTQGISKHLPATAVNDDAISALVNLGYSRSDAYRAVSQATQDAQTGTGLDAIIKLSLKELMRA